MWREGKEGREEMRWGRRRGGRDEEGGKNEEGEKMRRGKK